MCLTSRRARRQGCPAPRTSFSPWRSAGEGRSSCRAARNSSPPLRAAQSRHRWPKAVASLDPLLCKPSKMSSLAESLTACSPSPRKRQGSTSRMSPLPGSAPWQPCPTGPGRPGLEVKERRVPARSPGHVVEEGLRELVELLGAVQHEPRDLRRGVVEDQDVAVPVRELRHLASPAPQLERPPGAVQHPAAHGRADLHLRRVVAALVRRLCDEAVEARRVPRATTGGPRAPGGCTTSLQSCSAAMTRLSFWSATLAQTCSST